jgi:hypothetical protein
MTSGNLRIATWNLCLGISNKRDYIRSILIQEKIDILNMQETELDPQTDSCALDIRRYRLELEINEYKIRTRIYISNKLKCTRKADLELANCHIIVLDLNLNT